jgi:hypothetical protein
MKEKHSDSPARNKKPLQRGGELLANFGSGIALGTVAMQAVTGINIAREIDDPSIDKVVEILSRHNMDSFYTITDIDACPSPTDPADISVMYESIERQMNTPDAIAEKYNLEFIDNDKLSQYITPLVDAPTLQDATAVINEFTQSNMNMTIHADGLYEHTDVQLFDYKQRIWTFMMIMREIPTTLLDELDITDVTITNNNDGASGAFNRSNREVEFDINYLDSPSTVIHEILGHGVHHIVCNGVDFNDRSFASHNPPSYEYARDGWINTTPDPNYHPNRYATKSVGEDTASTTESYLVGAITTDLVEPQSSLDRKVALILDRINLLAPGSAEYLSSVINEFKSYENMHQERMERERSQR